MELSGECEDEGDARRDVVEVEMMSAREVGVAAVVEDWNWERREGVVEEEEGSEGVGKGPACVERSVVEESERRRRREKRERVLAVEVERSIGGPEVRRRRAERGFG